jgi:hypothetical protein
MSVYFRAVGDEFMELSLYPVDDEPEVSETGETDVG